VADALRDASATPGEVQALQMHGTGTPLGDPIETNAALSALRPGPVPADLALLATKAQVGHAEAAAGLVSVAAALEGCAAARANHNPHLRSLNPYVEQPMEAACGRPHLHRQSPPLPPASPHGTRTHCASAFAFQGTNAHAVVEHWAAPREERGPAGPAAGALLELDRSFVAPAAHRLVRAGAAAGDGRVTLRLDLGSALASAMKDHVVQGKVLLPGAAMLECCLAAASYALDDSASGGALVLAGTVIPAPLVVPRDGSVPAFVTVSPVAGRVELRSLPEDLGPAAAPRLNTRGAVALLPARPLPPAGPLPGPKPLPVRPGRGGVVACVAVLDLDPLGTSVEDYGVHPAVLDCAIQSGLTHVTEGSFVPAAAGGFWRDEAPADPFRGNPGALRGGESPGGLHASAVARPGPASLVTDFALAGSGGRRGPRLAQLTSKRLVVRPPPGAPPPGASAVVHAFAEVLAVSDPVEGLAARPGDGAVAVVVGRRGTVLRVPTAGPVSVAMAAAAESMGAALRDPRAGAVSLHASTGFQGVHAGLPGGTPAPAAAGLPGPAGHAAASLAVGGMARSAAMEAPGRGWSDTTSPHVDSLVAPCRRGGAFPAEPGRAGPPAGGTVAVTGGLGGLGALFAEWMASSEGRRGGPALLLLGRSGRGPAGLARISRASGGPVAAASCDAAGAEGAALVGGIARGGRVFGGRVSGVVHAAGVLRDGLVRGLTPGSLRGVLAPKAAGVEGIAGRGPVSWVVAVSSISALVGFPGQANYAGANAALESLAASLAQRGVPAVAVRLGALSAVGMAARSEGVDVLARTRRWGLGALAPAHALSSIARAMTQTPPASGAPASRFVASPLSLDVARRSLPTFAARHVFEPPESNPPAGDPRPAEAPPRDDPPAPPPAPAPPGGAVDVASELPLVTAAVERALRDVTGRDFGPEDSVAGAGIGEVRALRVVQGLEAELGLPGAVPRALLSDFPRVSDMVCRLAALLPDAHPFLAREEEIPPEHRPPRSASGASSAFGRSPSLRSLAPGPGGRRPPGPGGVSRSFSFSGGHRGPPPPRSPTPGSAGAMAR